MAGVLSFANAMRFYLKHLICSAYVSYVKGTTIDLFPMSLADLY